MGKKKLNIGHNLDFSISFFVNRNSYWGHENGKINLSPVFNCLISFFNKKIKDRVNFIFPSNIRHTSYTYLERTAKNQLFDVVQKFNISSRKKLVWLQNQPAHSKQRKVGFVLHKELW